MDSKILQNLKTLNKINKQRICWLRVSGLVVAFSLLILFKWNYLMTSNLIWAAAAFGIVITVVWWYWTMVIIRKLLAFKTSEAEILTEIISEIREIKQEVTKTFNQNT